MNDIDRSVESMDFAMRRRFTWKEVQPSDTDYMLDQLGITFATEAKQRMNRLNQAIAATDGLGAAYMIGPAYFLKLTDYNGDFDKLWKLNIEPLLREYLRGFRRTSELMKKFESAYFNGNQPAKDESVAETNED
jgi:5-methylcytosine-specific restriction endonuclease McrBC GTP-binding regulatory subunit McrB